MRTEDQPVRAQHDSWLAPPENLSLGEDEIHVWRVHLEQEPWAVKALRGYLNAAELKRADRYHFEKDRKHFVVARGVLRAVLSRYLDLPPGAIEFSYSPYGKPMLAEGSPDPSLRFNVSHSEGVALYAVTRGRETGLDIEFVREDFASLDIAERFFSKAEVSVLRALPPEWQTAAFFNCWTRKEAYIKALGEGLSHPLDRFSVSFAPNAPAALLSTYDDPQEVSRWAMFELFPGRGYVAALVVEGPAPLLRCWQWLM